MGAVLFNRQYSYPCSFLKLFGMFHNLATLLAGDRHNNCYHHHQHGAVCVRAFSPRPSGRVAVSLSLSLRWMPPIAQSGAQRRKPTFERSKKRLTEAYFASSDPARPACCSAANDLLPMQSVRRNVAATFPKPQRPVMTAFNNGRHICLHCGTYGGQYRRPYNCLLLLLSIVLQRAGPAGIVSPEELHPSYVRLPFVHCGCTFRDCPALLSKALAAYSPYIFS